MNLSAQIEAVLFFKNEAVSLSFLSKFFELSKDEIEEAISELKEKLRDRGICLIQNRGMVMLGTSPDASFLIKKIRKEELSRELGKASLETLSIILYQSPVRKTQIDYIRGVNSGSILRNLLVRGLVEKKVDKINQRSFLYYPTFELLAYLGISKLEDLPEYDKVRNELKKKEKNDEEKSSDSL